MTWEYAFFHYDPHAMPLTCQDDKCASKRATYRLVAEDGSRSAARSYCTNHSAAAAARLSLSFPPINSRRALGQG
jgi:hypothetical protein